MEVLVTWQEVFVESPSGKDAIGDALRSAVKIVMFNCVFEFASSFAIMNHIARFNA